MHSVAYDAAVTGCSCTKYQPDLTCNLYTLQQNSKCFVPSSQDFSTLALPSGVLIFKF